MEVKRFIENFKASFTDNAPLPIAFWYSSVPIADTQKLGGCLFKQINLAREGTPVTLTPDNIGCFGGKYYAGYIDKPERVPTFVSLTERYKRSPEMVDEYLDKLGMPRMEKPYLNFSRIDNIDGFDGIEGLLFFAHADMLSGLCAWAYFDRNEADAVCSHFGSGCSNIVSVAVVENRKPTGYRTFLGLFDVSVRPFVGVNELSFVIPMCRFKEMYHTISECCLSGSPAWKRVQQRLQEYYQKK